MSAHNILAQLGEFKIHGRAFVLQGDAAPDDTADVGWVYIRTSTSGSGDTVVYTWDATGATWDALTA